MGYLGGPKALLLVGFGAVALATGCGSTFPAQGDQSASRSGVALGDGSTPGTRLASAFRPGPNQVPPEFRAACGHPGATVHVRHVPVAVRHAQCNLTGVSLSYRNCGGAVVGNKPGGVTGNFDGTSRSGEFSLGVHNGSLDVTVDARCIVMHGRSAK